MKNSWPALLFLATACTRTVVVHEPTYAPPAYEFVVEAEAYVDVETEPVRPSNDVFELAARMIENTPPPVTLAPPMLVAHVPSVASTGAHHDGGATYGGEAVSVRAPATTIAAAMPAGSSVVRNHAALITFLRSIRQTHDFDSSTLRFADHPSQRSWMAAKVNGGGFLVAARRRTPNKRNPYSVVANVISIDAAGRVVWTADVGDAGFATFEVPELLVTPDGGAIARVLAYKHPARNGNLRFVKLDRDGRREWAVQLPGGVDTDVPHVNFMTRGPDGSVQLSGYWVRSAELTSKHDWSGHTRSWQGRLDRDGRLVESIVGAVPNDSGIRPCPVENPIGDAVDAP